jgi:H+/Cl- antiporter ClcA
VINELFRPNSFDMAARWANPSLTANLAIYVVCKFVFTCIAVGCPISCGVFTPVFLIGAAGGRLFGELLNDITPVDVQITAGGYAVVGAAALAAGVTRTVSTSARALDSSGQLWESLATPS